jgi:hypothetical protein
MQYPVRKREEPVEMSFAVLMAVLGSTIESMLSWLKVSVENVSKRINLMEKVLDNASKVEAGSIGSCQPQFYI